MRIPVRILIVRPSGTGAGVQVSISAHHKVSLRDKGGIIMAQVSQVANWRPVPEKLDTFIGQLAKAKGIHERFGGNGQRGADPGRRRNDDGRLHDDLRIGGNLRCVHRCAPTGR